MVETRKGIRKYTICERYKTHFFFNLFIYLLLLGGVCIFNRFLTKRLQVLFYLTVEIAITLLSACTADILRRVFCN